VLPVALRREDDVFGRGEQAQAGDGKFAADDDDDIHAPTFTGASGRMCVLSTNAMNAEQTMILSASDP